jgi:hypothetical protein
MTNMKTVNISSSELSLYETFQEGHPVQVRVSVSPEEEHEFDKGKTVKVIYDKKELEGKIVSQPLEIEAEGDDGQKTLSLVLEKP